MVRMAIENTDWGYDRIVGALSNLGHPVSDQTVGNILRRHGIAPAPKRGQSTTWKDFIAAHMNVLVGADFFTWKCSLGGGWRPNMCCSSSMWKVAESMWRASPETRIKSGWNKLLAAPRRRAGDIWMDAVMFWMTVTRNSAHPFGRCWRRVAWKRSHCHPEVRI